LLEYKILLQHCSLAFLTFNIPNYFDDPTRLFSYLYPAKFSLRKENWIIKNYSKEMKINDINWRSRSIVLSMKLQECTTILRSISLIPYKANTLWKVNTFASYDVVFDAISPSSRFPCIGQGLTSPRALTRTIRREWAWRRNLPANCPREEETRHKWRQRNVETNSV